jgi:hypothetical protein
MLEADYSGEVATDGTFLDLLELESNPNYQKLIDGDTVLSGEFNFDTMKEGYVAPNLEKIVFGGATKYMRKSFFYYMGSETTPNCEQAVRRFVMAEPVKIPADLLDQLKRAMYDIYTYQDGNSRKINENWMKDNIWAPGG